MTWLFHQNPDGSATLEIDGDLQWDSRDEPIYHEFLTLPALALAQRRAAHPLHALICGGGDGLAARELLKSPALVSLDLVDYDATIVAAAQTNWAYLNRRALADSRVHLIVADAWDVVADAPSASYDLIICDFTVPTDAAGARLYSTEWFAALHRLLLPAGLLACNVIAPSRFPAAFWSTYNTLRHVGLSPRPFRIAIPSFRARGYGDDWGFCLASPTPLTAADFDDRLPLAGPRVALTDAAQLRRCFVFPATSALLRCTVSPLAAHGNTLLELLANPTPVQVAAADPWHALDWDIDPAPLPVTDDAPSLLPTTLRGAFGSSNACPVDEQSLLAHLLAIVPVLRRDQTLPMLEAFLDAPARFLEALDLRGLVTALLRRSAELPRSVVAELRILRAELIGPWSVTTLLQRGLRIVSAIALVVLLSNLLHPDTLYGKGTGEGDAAPALAHTSYAGGGVGQSPSYVSGSGYRPGYYRSRGPVDEIGSLFPPRRYRYYHSYYGHGNYRSYNPAARPADPNQGDALYRLTPEADVLDNGAVMVSLSDRASLLLADDVTTLLDSTTGEPVLFLRRDPALYWRTQQELIRQRLGMNNSVLGKQEWIKWVDWLDFSPWHAADTAELVNLQTTVNLLDESLKNLGPVPAQQPPLPQPPLPSAVQLFSSVWADPAGKQVIVERPSGLAFVTSRGWWSDPTHQQPITDPYPASFRTLLGPLLKQTQSDVLGSDARLQSALSSARQDQAMLQGDLATYTGIQRARGSAEVVEYGTSNIPVAEALTRTADDLRRTAQLIESLTQQNNARPQLTRAIAALLTEFAP
ncbi:MAG: hypothetical protein NVSMB42_15990 [Herpetosiphon sp.]